MTLFPQKILKMIGELAIWMMRSTRLSLSLRSLEIVLKHDKYSGCPDILPPRVRRANKKILEKNPTHIIITKLKTLFDNKYTDNFKIKLTEIFIFNGRKNNIWHSKIKCWPHYKLDVCHKVKFFMKIPLQYPHGGWKKNVK